MWRVRDKAGEVPGIDDKRLVSVETEFASLLNTLRRQGNTLSPMLRQAWDDKTIETLAKNSPARCTRPHISVVGTTSRPRSSTRSAPC